MDREKANVLWFDQLHRKDVNLVGGKSSSLGEMTSSMDVPVPYGFATTASAYREFMDKTGLITNSLLKLKITKTQMSYTILVQKFVKLLLKLKCRMTSNVILN